MKRNPASKAPIWCFVGPPGVGKTSVGQSIARAIGRKFERMSLGGLHDEAELRGHRRTYIGAMPGRVIQAIRRAGVRNPLLMLDEIDKLGHDFRGDPAAALMEILDPAQNRDVLYVEAVLLPDVRDGSELILTGQLGEVMEESAQAAHSFVWSQASELGIDKERFAKSGVHIHVPAGATPKDGPSAGVTMVTALASIYSHLPAGSDTVMTGEITLTGLVLPVGGIKEKVLAAHRAGFRRIVLPKENEKDLAELPDDVRSAIEFVLVEHVEQALTATIPDMGERLRIAWAS